MADRPNAYLKLLRELIVPVTATMRLPAHFRKLAVCFAAAGSLTAY
jgi:hypothetical protein